jgi:hypothetical protein
MKRVYCARAMPSRNPRTGIGRNLKLPCEIKLFKMQPQELILEAA